MPIKVTSCYNKKNMRREGIGIYNDAVTFKEHLISRLCCKHFTRLYDGCNNIFILVLVNGEINAEFLN